MNPKKIINRNIESIGWGLVFIWWGITEMVTTLPDGSGALGLGLILLGLNVVRSFNGIAANSFTTTLGILLLVLGGLQMTEAVFRLPFQLPIFAVLLLVFGAILIARQLLGNKTA